MRRLRSGAPRLLRRATTRTLCCKKGDAMKISGVVFAALFLDLSIDTGRRKQSFSARDTDALQARGWTLTLGATRS